MVCAYPEAEVDVVDATSNKMSYRFETMAPTSACGRSWRLLIGDVQKLPSIDAIQDSGMAGHTQVNG